MVIVLRKLREDQIEMEVDGSFLFSLVPTHTTSLVFNMLPHIVFSIDYRRLTTYMVCKMETRQTKMQKVEKGID